MVIEKKYTSNNVNENTKKYMVGKGLNIQISNLFDKCTICCQVFHPSLQERPGFCEVCTLILKHEDLCSLVHSSQGYTFTVPVHLKKKQKTNK